MKTRNAGRFRLRRRRIDIVKTFARKTKTSSQDVGIVHLLAFKKKKNKKNKNKNKTSAFDEEDGRASTEKREQQLQKWFVRGLPFSPLARLNAQRRKNYSSTTTSTSILLFF